MSRRKHHEQLSLESAIKETGRGGPRRGSGRPRGRKTVSHDKRPEFAQRYPQNVTLRALDGTPPLARDWLMKAIRRVIRESHKPFFRIVEFNVLGNHLHLICEAGGARLLGRGVQGFVVRLVRRLNKMLGRKGKYFANRYHARSLTSPREVRNAIRYVLCNRKHHAVEKRFDKFWVDPYSSAPWFSGWAQPLRTQLQLAREEKPTADATVWLLTTGWRRHGPLSFDERPA